MNKIKAIAKFLGCNEGELQSEMAPLIDTIIENAFVYGFNAGSGEATSDEFDILLAECKNMWTEKEFTKDRHIKLLINIMRTRFKNDLDKLVSLSKDYASCIESGDYSNLKRIDAESKEIISKYQ